MLNEASVRPVHVSLKMRLRFSSRILTGQELVQPHEELNVGILALGDLCAKWSITTVSVIERQVAGALLRRLDGEEEARTAMRVSHLNFRQ